MSALIIAIFLLLTYRLVEQYAMLFIMVKFLYTISGVAQQQELLIMAKFRNLSD